MTSRQLRLLRAGAASAVATLIAAVSHTIGGGVAPHPLLVLAVTAFLTPLSALLIGSRVSRARVAATVGVSQAVFHLAFQYLGTPTGSPAIGPHTHHVELPAAIAATVPLPDAGMIAAHVLAAMLTTLLVWRGEAVLRTIARWMRALLRLPVPRPLAEHTAPSPLRVSVRVFGDALFSSTAPRRGPPVLVRG